MYMRAIFRGKWDMTSDVDYIWWMFLNIVYVLFLLKKTYIWWMFLNREVVLSNYSCVIFPGNKVEERGASGLW